MGNTEKLIAKMRNNHNDWRINDLKTIAKRYKISYRQPGTSHVTFRDHKGNKITVPAHKPLKPAYIKLFLDLIDKIGE
jgi:predicted RNA binding protein YcfA (HicA-like mRNA interferase family)